MTASIFAGKTTLTNFQALVAPFNNATESWLVANGYPAALSTNDATIAGLV